MRSNTPETTDLVIFTEEMLNGKLHSSCCVKKAQKEQGVTIILKGYP